MVERRYSGARLMFVIALSCSRLNPLSSPSFNIVTSSHLSKQFYGFSPVIRLLDRVDFGEAVTAPGT